MRVLVLSHSSAVDNYGGAERSMVEFLEDWQAADSTLELFVISRSPTGHLQPELERLGIPWTNLPFTSVVRHRRAVDGGEVYESARYDFGAVRAIERFIVEYGADLVMTNTIVAPWAAIAAKMVPVPHVWFVHEYGDGHEFQIPPEHVFADIGILSDLVVASSEALSEHVSRWTERDKMWVLYPSLERDVKRSEPAADLMRWPVDEKPNERGLRLVCVGRLSASKGQARIVRSVARLRNAGVLVSAVFVGSSSEDDHRELVDLIEQLGVTDQIAFTGELADPRPVVELADVGVVASDSEGFGRVTVEYMSASKPVIGAAVGATVELIEHGVTGRLFTLDEESSLDEAIRAYVTARETIVEHGAAALIRYRDDIAKRHQVAPLLDRLKAVAESVSDPLVQLPNIMLSWLSLPEIVVEQLTTSGAMVDPTTSRTWRTGRAVLSIPRRFARLLRPARSD